MNFEIVDTEAIYRRMLAAPDDQTRRSILHDELIMPFAGMMQLFGGAQLSTFAQWGMTPEQFGGTPGERMARIVEMLAAHDAWGRAARALEVGRAAFADHLGQIGLERIVFGLCLADMSAMPLQHGYSGFGAIPGWIMTIYDEPSPENLARVETATVHELHHNVRFRLFPFNPMTATVGEYLVAEGLAESFAAALYGADLIGPWVLEFDESRLEEARAVVGVALEQSGFGVVRGYIFGDVIAEHMGLPKAGVPDYAGYALGYKVVQAYMQRSGASIVEATLAPAQQIIADSEFFSARAA